MRIVRGFRAILLVAIPVLLADHSSGQVWDRPICEGITYRMEVQSNPSRMIVGLRIDPKVVRLESQLAKGVVYDSSKVNGRDTVTGMVRQFGATTGINGDFFQFGSDPGGDPQGFMVRHGELISLPSPGTRFATLTWDTLQPWQVHEPKTRLKLIAGAKSIDLGQLNAKTSVNSCNLTTEIGAEVYGDGEMEALFLDAGRTLLRPNGDYALRVKKMITVNGRVVLAPGEWVVTATGTMRSTLSEICRAGDTVVIQAKTEGFSGLFSAQSMGGGPELLRDGKYVGPADNDEFSKTRHPRSLVGLTADGMIWQVVIDGRQTMSTGASLSESGEILKRWGCVQGMNLDGGGSSAINAFGLTLNRPSGGTERYVANGILGYGPSVGPGPMPVIEVLGEPVVGKKLKVRVRVEGRELPLENVVLVAQGAGWVTPDGTLTVEKAGTIVVSALVGGRIGTIEAQAKETSKLESSRVLL